MHDVISAPAGARPLRDYHPHGLEFSEYGVKDFVMPVSEAAADRVFADFCACAAALLRNEGFDRNATAEALGLSLIYMGLEATHFFILSGIAEKNTELDRLAHYGDSDGALGRIAAGDKASSQFVSRFRGFGAKPSAVKTWGRFAKSILRRDAYSRKPPFLIDRRNDILCFAADPWHQKLAAQAGKRLVLSSHENWFGGSSATSDVSAHIDRDLVSAMADIAIGAFEREGVRELPSVRESLREIFSGLAAVVLRLMTALEQNRRLLPNEFWTISTGGLHARLVSRLVRKQGGTVTNYDHGTGAGWMDSPELLLVEWDQCDTFIAFSQAQADGVKALIARAARYSLSGKAPEVVASPLPLYDTSIAGANSGRHSPARTRVWYVPSAYTGERFYLPPLPPDIVAADFQMRLFRQLRDLGHEIIIKPHPECPVGFPPAMLAGAEARIETRSFEHVADAPDVVIMDYPHSTAFRSAVLSNVPLVVLDPGRVAFLPEARRLLERGAARVEFTFDEQNRRRIDKDRLAQAIEHAPQLTDRSFQQAYYPSGPASAGPPNEVPVGS